MDAQGGGRPAILLIRIGWALYVLSFFLPALHDPGGGDVLNGGQAFYMSCMATAMVFQGYGAFLVLPAVACLGNLAMALSPLPLVLGDRGRFLRTLPDALLTLAVVNVLALLMPPARGFPLPGFWLWDASYALVGVGLMRRDAARVLAARSPAPRPWGA